MVCVCLVWRGPSGYEMVRVEPGAFQMGSPPDEPGRSDDELQHTVSLEGYWLGVSEVTQALWGEVMGDNPSLDDLEGYALRGPDPSSASSDLPLLAIAFSRRSLACCSIYM